MDMLIKAEAKDLQEICELYQATVKAMEDSGLTQWHWGIYPTEAMLAEDIELRRLYKMTDNGRIAACVMLGTDVDPEYDKVNWIFGTRPGLFHRLAVHPDFQGRGVGGMVLDDAEQILRDWGCDSLRCDTNADNERALKMYESRGMRRCGTCTWGEHTHATNKTFYCLEKRLRRELTLLPQRMHPAFRGGSLTPWGGDKLKTVYNKPIAEVPTGESLEVSCIPGLESTDDMGRKLPELIKEFGESFAGRYAEQPFPLLLKIIDAKESLSVQVHPDDEYAGEHENGKLGKTEAWLILDAPKNGELVYGIVPGQDKETLRAACEKGKAVGKLLRRVKVKPGDVCYIPAGCVHAIGAGITLYEIQQSSDVTYRFYDWDRKDAKGNKRELHIDKALDVTDLKFALDPVRASKKAGETQRVLDETYFTLDLMNVDGQTEVPAIHEFGLLTVLDGELELSWENGRMTVVPGESLYLPTSSPALTLKGTGRAALSMPD